MVTTMHIAKACKSAYKWNFMHLIGMDSNFNILLYSVIRVLFLSPSHITLIHAPLLAKYPHGNKYCINSVNCWVTIFLSIYDKTELGEAIYVLLVH